MAISPRRMINRLHLPAYCRAIAGSTIWAVEIDLEPKVAADWLARHNNKNRKQQKGRLQRLTATVASGKLIRTHQGIAFDTDGEMISGQYRCTACVKADKPIQVLVFINCDPEERKVIDQPTSRGVKDVGQLGYGDDQVSAMLISTARAMYNGATKAPTLTPQDTYEFIDTHRKALDYVLALVTRKIPGLTSASVLGAAARAYYHVPRSVLKRFLEVMISGLPQDAADTRTITLRNKLSEKRTELRDWHGRYLAYCWTEVTLDQLWHNDESGLYVPKEDLFPLPATKQT